jgi:hypothetical protein
VQQPGDQAPGTLCTSDNQDAVSSSLAHRDLGASAFRNTRFTVTPISRPVVKMQRKFFWQRQLPMSFIGRFQLLCSYRARFFG